MSELLLNDVLRFLRRFVVMSEHQATAVALWVAHTHAFEAADVTPYLTVTSALKRSGKSRLLEVLKVVPVARRRYAFRADMARRRPHTGRVRARRARFGALGPHC